MRIFHGAASEGTGPCFLLPVGTGRSLAWDHVGVWQNQAPSLGLACFTAPCAPYSDGVVGVKGHANLQCPSGASGPRWSRTRSPGPVCLMRCRAQSSWDLVQCRL